MTESYSILKRENPFQFFASEFIGDVPTTEILEKTEAPVGTLCYVISTGYTYIQASEGIWRQLKAGKGTTGDRGPMGFPGENGVNGRDGRDGRDGSAGKNGSQGPPGEKGEKGETGDRGSQGPSGKDGRDGANGRDGLDGTDGAPGTTGRVGPRGADGTDGKNGRGWSGGSYNYETGKVTFKSDDGLGFQTEDLRGAPSPWAHMSIEQLANALKPYL